MANDQGPKASVGASNILIVGISVLMVVALMAWLFIQQQNRAAATVAAVDSTAAAPAGEVGGAAPTHSVSDTVFEQNVKTYVGQVVEVKGVKFSSALSPQTFWVELPSGAPFLIKLDSAMVAAGTAPPASGALNIVGTVQNKDAALVSQWVQSGVLQNDDQKMQAEFGTTYIEARQIRPAGGQ